MAEIDVGSAEYSGMHMTKLAACAFKIHPILE